MNPDELSAIAGADQLTAHCINVAGNVAAYHRTLLAQGISRKLADNLTLQMADAMWNPCNCEGE